MRSATGTGTDWSVPAALLELEQAGDRQLLADVVSIFREDTLTRLEHLRLAVRQDDCDGIRREVHAITGSATQLGAEGMAALCRQIESRAREGEASELASAVHELQGEFDRIWLIMAARTG